MPGIPMLPFLAIGGGASALAFIIDKPNKQAVVTEAKKAEAEGKTEAADEPITTTLRIDDLKVELGDSLRSLVNSPDGTDRLTEQIKALRRSLATEMGFVRRRCAFSTTCSSTPTPMSSRSRKSKPAAASYRPRSTWSWIRPADRSACPGTHTTEPTFGLPTTWGDASLKEEAAMKGYTGVDATTVLSTHLTAVEMKGIVTHWRT